MGVKSMEKGTLTKQQEVVTKFLEKQQKTSEKLAKKQEKYKNQDFRNRIAASVALGGLLGVCSGATVGLFKLFEIGPSLSGEELNREGLTACVVAGSIPIVACVLNRKLLKMQIKLLEKKQAQLEQCRTQEQEKMNTP